MPKITVTPLSARCLFPVALVALALLALCAGASVPGSAEAAGGPTVSPIDVLALSIETGGDLELTFTPAITATKAYTLATDLDSDRRVDPLDVVTYTIVIRNEGTAATGIVLTDALDVNTSLVGAVKTTPLAINDTYSATGNVPISVPAPGVLANDRDIDGGAVSVLPLNGVTTAQSGTVTVTADGGFLYLPPVGFTGTDAFTCTVTDDEGQSDRSMTAITVTDMIWFVNNAAGGANKGTLDHPFTTLASFSAVNNGTGRNPAPGQSLFVYAGAHTGGVNLLSNQKLIGQGATGASLAAVAGISLAPNSLALPPVNGTRPTISNAGGAGVTVAQNNMLRGFNAGSAVSASIVNSSTVGSVGGLTISEVSIDNPAGGAMRILSGGSVTATFGTLSSSGSNGSAFSLVNAGGRVTADTGALSGGSAGNPVVNLSGGSATFLYSGTVTSAVGVSSIQVAGKTGGDVLFSGNVADTGAGIAIQNNTGIGSVTFSGPNKVLTTGANQAVKLANNPTTWSISFIGGGLVVNTTSGVAFGTDPGNSAVSGTVLVTGPGNTLASTTGHGLYVRNATIGAGGLNFASIRSETASANAGIHLESTGSTAGLTVSGSGSGTCNSSATCTGGAIATKSGNGVYLKDTVNASFTRMYIGNNGGSGVFGLNVNGFVLDTSYLTNNGDDVMECGVRFGDGSSNGLIGSAANPTRISNTSILSSGEFNLYVLNRSGALTDLYLQNSTFNGRASQSAGADGFLIETREAATATARIEGCTFASHYTQGIQGNATDSSALTVRVTGSTFTDNYEGVVLSNSEDADLTFEVGRTGAANTFTGHLGVAIAVNNGTTATGSAAYTGKVMYNSITGVADMENRGIMAALTGPGTRTLQVSNNTLTGITNYEGIWIQNGELTGDSVNGQVTLTNNSVANNSGIAYPIQVQSRQNSTLCATITGNTATNSGGSLTGIRVRHRDASTFRLPGYGGTQYDTTAVQTFVSGNNSGTAASASTSSTGGGFVGGAACPTPP